VIGLALISTGCCMCDSPYDYCGPTFLGECGEPCMCHERYGSAISDGHCGFYCHAGGCQECGEVIEGPTEAEPEETPSEMYYEEGAAPMAAARPRTACRPSAIRALYEPPSVPQPKAGYKE
jgi:hypothetical protein